MSATQTLSLSRFKIWWMAIRPPTLIASVSPVCIGTALAVRSGPCDLVIFLMTLFYALFIQIGTNFTNDFIDYLKGADTSNRKGPTRVTQAGLVTVPEMQRATRLVFGLAALAGGYLTLHGGGLTFALLIVVSIFLGYIYTAGPFPLAYLGLGELFILPFFGPIASLMTYQLQTGEFSWQAGFAGIAPGALSCAILVVNNLRDYEEDKKANKKTLIVRFGKRFGQIEYIFFLSTALAVPVLLMKSFPFALLALISAFIAVPLMRQISSKENILSLLPKTAGLLILFTLLFCLGIAL